MKRVFACAVVLSGSLLASVAHAGVTFSFASDINSDGPTFYGSGTPTAPNNFLEDGEDFDAGSSVIVGLAVDVNGNAPGGGTIFNSVFDFDGITTGYSVSAFGGGWVHNWSMAGSFTFTETGSGLEVLQIDFTNALFTSFSPDQFELGTTAAIQANAATDAGLLFTPGLPLIGLGIDASDLGAGEGFGFTLTDIQSPEGMPLHLGQGGSWFHDWTAEGSFSAVASAVPAPGAMALLFTAMLVGCRRRRTA